MNAMLLMIQGTSSGSGKSTIVTALCRIFADHGYNVAPFKAQNMSSYSYTVSETLHSMAMAQAIQAVASRKEPDVIKTTWKLSKQHYSQWNILL
ncbi:MAG: cobQ [Nitrososphaeraceae archaeon]|nr:cobQ [Nitrososphaeraceae archaeon]